MIITRPSRETREKPAISLMTTGEMLRIIPMARSFLSFARGVTASRHSETYSMRISRAPGQGASPSLLAGGAPHLSKLRSATKLFARNSENSSNRRAPDSMKKYPDLVSCSSSCIPFRAPVLTVFLSEIPVALSPQFAGSPGDRRRRSKLRPSRGCVPAHERGRCSNRGR